MGACSVLKSAQNDNSPIHETTSLAQDYLDALLLRVLPGTDDWYRNHFPVILETNMSHYFGELIYNQMNVDEMTYPTVEFGHALPSGDGIGNQPYDVSTKTKNLSHIFNQSQVELMH